MPDSVASLAWLSPRRAPFWLLIALMLYTLGGFFLAPWLIERAAVKTIAETGRSLDLGAVKVNPFVLGMELQNVELRDTDGEVLFSCEDAYANLQLSSLFHWAWTFRELRLLKPFLKLERFRSGDDRVSVFVNALAGPEADAEPPAPESAAALRLLVQQLVLSNGQVALADHLPGREFTTVFGPIKIQANALSTLPDQAGQQQVRIATNSGGSIAWNGTLQLSPLRSQGRVTVSGAGMEDMYRYLNLLLPVTAKGAAVDVAFDYQVAMQGSGELHVAAENMAGEINDIQVTLGDAGREIVRLPQLKFAGGMLHWPEQKASFDSLAIDAAQLNILRLQDGSIDLQELFAPAPDAAAKTETSADTATAGNSPAAAWAIELKQLEVNGAAVSFEDRTMEPPVTVGVHDLALSVSGISNRAEAKFPTRLEFELAEGGKLGFDGETSVLPAFTAAGELDVEGAALAVAQPWIASVAHVAVKSGTASLKGKIVHTPEETAAYRGSARVDGFELTDTNRGEQLLGVQALATERIEFSLDGRSLETSVLKLTRPYGRVAIAPDKTTNLTGLMVEGKAGEAPGEEANEARPLVFTLGGFEIADASIDFSDHSLPLPFAAAIRTMNGTVSTVSTATEEPAKIQLEGQVNEFGLARISGSVNARSFGTRSDIKVIFRNLETARLSPYTIGFAGYEIADGRLDLYLDYKIRKGKLSGTNKIISRQLVLGKKVEQPGGTSLPLQLAVALLTDSDGVIDLDLPISGDINDPQFRLGGVIAKALAGMIGKIITSPFRLLGMLAGVDAEDFGTLNFVPGSAAISPPDQEKLLKLAAAMKQRPKLTLEVGGVYAPERDREALQAEHLDAEIEARMEAQKQSGEELSSALRRRITEALFEQAFPDTTLEAAQAEYMRAAASDESEPAQQVLDETAYLAGLHQRLVGQQQVADTELVDLAGSRADAVIAVLRESGEGSEPSLKRAEVRTVKAAESGEIPLELKVSVADRAR